MKLNFTRWKNNLKFISKTIISVFQNKSVFLVCFYNNYKTNKMESDFIAMGVSPEFVEKLNNIISSAIEDEKLKKNTSIYNKTSNVSDFPDVEKYY